MVVGPRNCGSPLVGTINIENLALAICGAKIGKFYN